MIAKIKHLYTRLKPHVPTICFLSGSTWDALTLRRIDNSLDMTILSCYLFLSAIIVILIARRVKFRFSQHLPSAAQFFYGGMFSACTVYYFKSTSSTFSFIFLLSMAGLLVCNEFLEKKYSNAQITFAFWSICAVMILNFLLPVLLKKMNAWVFLLAVLSALLLCAAIIRLSSLESLSLIPVLSVYSVLVFLYFLNVIPPVPLSQKHGSVCHSVIKSKNEYSCIIEKPVWYRPFKKVIHFTPGDTVFFFSSVFAPTRLQKRIYHHWYYKDPQKGKWLEISKIGYTLSGGRDKGYRGYSFKKNVTPGLWKINLKTDDGKTLGITTFSIISRNTDQPLKLSTLVY